MNVLGLTTRDCRTMASVMLLVTLSGLVYVYPFHSHFRFTVGVAMLAVLLLYFDRLPPVTTTVMCGLAVIIGRSFADFLFTSGDFAGILAANFPSVFFYIVYGALFYWFKTREQVDNVPLLILLLSLADLAGNTVELSLRSETLAGGPEIFSPVIGVAIFRAVLTAAGYYSLRRYRAFVLAADQAARYSALTVMIANLQAELYYLHKSSQDIESVMEDSYLLYQRLQQSDGSGADRALAIARNIHEVKKDYTRVTAGIEAVLEPSLSEKGMRLTVIFDIIEQNTRRYLAGQDKAIIVNFNCQGDFITNKHYSIVSILDNLITNAAQACGKTGRIDVSHKIEAGKAVFCVEDNGCGIKPEDVEMVFHPGYSTKYHPVTGKMSTGLGLAHVKNLAKLLGGTVSLMSDSGRLTRFTVELPLSGLNGEGRS